MNQVIKPLKEVIKLKAAIGVIENDRKLARIVKIDDVFKHPNADALSVAIIGGWQCVTRLNEYKAGDLAVYCEIDSLLPISHPEFMFLESRNADNRMIDGKVYHKLGSIKLRKELSQGLLIPVPEKYKELPVDTNLTNELGILKYDNGRSADVTETVDVPVETGILSRIIHLLMNGIAESLEPWPAGITKSDQDRVQNRVYSIVQAQLTQELFEVTYKLNGSSMTVFCINDAGIRTGVCSRNNELVVNKKELTLTSKVRYFIGTLLKKNQRFFKNWKFTKPVWLTTAEGAFNTYATKNKIVEALIKYHTDTGRFITVKGELIGPGIQDGFEGVTENEFYVYTVYEDGNIPLLPQDAIRVVKELGLKYIPILQDDFIFPPEWTVRDILDFAEGERAFNQKKGTYREGLVFKSKKRPFSVKAISNSYLLKFKD